MGTPRAGHSAFLLPTGRVLVIDGIVDSSGVRVATSEEYDPTSGTWSPSGNSIPNAPPASVLGLCGFGAALLGNGKVLVAGGGCADNGTTTNAASLYDPVTHQWAPAASMNFGRDQFGMVTLANGNVLAFGGCAGGCSGPNILGQFIFQVGTSAEIYNYQTNTWTQVASLNSVRGNSPAAETLSDGRVLTCGGSNGFNIVFTSCEVYDPVANTWTNTGSMPGPAVGWPMVLLQDGRVLSIEPQPGPQPGPHSIGTLSTMTWNPATGQWTSTGALSTRQDQGRFTLLQNGQVLLSGGSNGTSFVDTARIFDPTMATWNSVGPMVSPRASHSATLLPNGQVLIAGGGNGTSLLSSAEIFAQVINVAIDIKPGSDPNSINPKSKGKIPVAILSTASFSAPNSVNISSLKFGRTGSEASLAFCSASPQDVNGDGFLDLVCHFNTPQTGFQAGDAQGILRGQTVSGTPITGTDSVQIVPF